MPLRGARNMDESGSRTSFLREAVDDVSASHIAKCAATRSLVAVNHLIAPMITTADRPADSPVGQILVRHRSLRPLDGLRNRMRARTNFMSRFKLIWLSSPS